MKKIIVNYNTKVISDEIASKSAHEAEYFPIDRQFLNQYMDRVLTLDPVQFAFCNFERVNPTYTCTLFLCLPEIWRKLELMDLLRMMENFTNAFSYYSLIQFSYKYLEINILPF